MNYETWVANLEERRGAHIDIDRTEVEEYYLTYLYDLTQLDSHCDDSDMFDAEAGLAFDATLSYFEDQGLTEELLEDILDDGRG